MSASDFQEHQDYFDWFVRTTRPQKTDLWAGARRATHANIGIMLYPPTEKEAGLQGVTFCYLRPGHSAWDLSTGNLNRSADRLSDRLDYWSTYREGIIILAGIGNDLRQIAIVTAMLNYPPPSSLKTEN